MNENGKQHMDDLMRYQELSLFDLLVDIYRCKWIITGICISSLIIVGMVINYKFPIIYKSEFTLLFNSSKKEFLKKYFATDFNKDQIISLEVLSYTKEQLNEEKFEIKEIKPFLSVEYFQPEDSLDFENSKKNNNIFSDQIKISFATEKGAIYTRKIRENILSTIIDSYKLYLKKRFTKIYGFYETQSDYEFYSILDRLEKKINNIKEYIENDLLFLEKNYYLPELILNIKEIEDELNFLNDNDLKNIRSKILDKVIIKDKKTHIERLQYDIDRLNSLYNSKILQVKAAQELIGLIKSKSTEENNSKLVEYALDKYNEATKYKSEKEDLESELKRITTRKNVNTTKEEIDEINNSLINLNLKVEKILKEVTEWRFKYATEILENQISIVNSPNVKKTREVNIYIYLLITLFFTFSISSLGCVFVLYIKRNTLNKL